MKYIIDTSRDMENADMESEKLNYILGCGEYLRSNLERQGDLLACMEAYFGNSATGREIVDAIFAELMATDNCPAKRQYCL